jgi:hypothetical protein
MTKAPGLGRKADELAMHDGAVQLPPRYDEHIGTATAAELESVR